MGKKTTTVTFRIDTELKNELIKRSEAQNQTISETAKNLLSESLSLLKSRSMLEQAQEDAKEFDEEINLKLKSYNLKIDELFSSNKFSSDLLAEYQLTFNDMKKELKEYEKQKNGGWLSYITFLLSFISATILIINFFF